MLIADVVNSRLAGLFLALLAGMLVSLVVLRLGRQRFSLQLFSSAFAVGMLSAIPAAALERLISPHLSGARTFDGAIFTAFAVAGLVEESGKLAIGYCFVRPHYLARGPRDVTLGVAVVALGFALVENIGYVTNAGGQIAVTALVRAALTVPSHAFTGLLLGWGVARTEGRRGFDRFWRLIAGALVPAALLHGLFDLPLFLGNEAPAYTKTVVDLATRLRVAAPTLLDGVFTVAVALDCVAAAVVIRAINAMPLDGDRRYKIPEVKPVWLKEAIHSPATTNVTAGLVTIGCAAVVAVAIYSIYVGALVSSAFSIARYTFCSSILGWALLSNRSDSMEGSANALVVRRDWPFAAAALIVAALFVFTNNLLRNALVAQAMSSSGFARVMIGDEDRGVANFNTALVYDPDSRDALIYRAGVEVAKNQYNSASVDLDHLVALDGQDPVALALRGRLLVNRHEYQAAEADLTRALQFRPNDIHLLTERASVRRYLGEFKPSSSDLDRARQIDPSSPVIQIAQIEIDFIDGNLNAVMRELENAPRLDPAAFLFLSGRVQFLRGDFAHAVDNLRAASEGQDLYPALWGFLGAARAGQDGAKDLAAAVARSKGKQWPLPLAQAFLGEKTIDEARSEARDADDLCEVDFYNGERLLARGERTAAMQSLSRAESHCPISFIEFSAARIESIKLRAMKTGA